MSDLLLDLQGAFRGLRRRPGFALLAILTLAIGMSVNTTAFSVVNGLLFKGGDYRDFTRLGWILVGSRAAGGDATVAEYEAFRRHATLLDAVIGEARVPLRFRDGGRTDQVWALAVSGNYFEVLGTRAEVGRLLASSDGDSPVAMVSHAFWQSRLQGAAPGHATLLLNDRQFSVIGVLPPDHQGPGGIYVPDVWVSLEARQHLGLTNLLRGTDSLTLVGRTAPGASPAQIEAQLTGLLAAQVPATPGEKPRVASFAPMPAGHPEQRALAGAAVVAMGAVGLVLLIACFNVAGLLLTRATERRREMAMRAALGASGGRLVRQLMVEALVVAGAGGLLALLFAWLSPPLLAAFSLPAPIPQRIDLSPDGRTVAFTLLLVIVGAVVPALFPARQAVRLDLQAALASETGNATSSHGRVRARRAFQVLQVAGSTLFLALAMLFGGSFRNMLSADLGFEGRQALIVTIDPQVHGRTAQQAESFVRELSVRVKADPRTRDVAATRGIPYTVGTDRGTTLAAGAADCRTVKCQPAQLFVVDPGYHQAMSIPLVGGRALSDADRLPGGGVVVNRAAAERLWPGRSPIGHTLTIGTTGETVPVVGLVNDVAARGIGRDPGLQVYRAMRTEDYRDAVTFIVGTRGEPGPLVERVRREATALDASFPLQTIQTMQEHLSLPLWPGRVAAWFLSICGGIALVLASVGLFGVISYAAAQRGREFGIRMALGAQAASIYRLVFSEGLLLTGIGVALGLLAAVGAGNALQAGLVGVRASDPQPYLLAVLLQGVVALAACSHPARKATSAARRNLVSQLHAM